MGSDLRYNLINSFRSIDIWRANIIFNMWGSVTPGFKKREISMGIESGNALLRSGESQSPTHGSSPWAVGSNSELVVRGYSIVPSQVKPTREQGSTASPTHLSIVGDGFFAVAESEAPGARVFFTRNGRFHWKQTGVIDENGTKNPRWQLVNDQGLIVLRAKDIMLDDTGATKVRQPADPAHDPIGLVISKSNPPGERDGEFEDVSKKKPGIIKGILGDDVHGDITGVDDATIFDASKDEAYVNQESNHRSNLAIVRLPSASRLVTSSYGGEIYEAPLQARQGIVVRSLHDWWKAEFADGPHVLPMSLESLDARGMLDQLNIESETANFVYKNLSTFMQDYNKSIDDLLSIIR